MFRRTRQFLGGLMPTGLAGAFLALTVGRVSAPGETSRIVLLILGWLYGVAVIGLLRLIPVSPWCYPWVGMIVGPVPFALLVNAGAEDGERGMLWLATALVGFLLGLIEWGRESRVRARRPLVDCEEAP